MSFPEFNWTGLNLNESVNKWVGDPLSMLADVIGMSENDRKEAINWATNIPLVGDYLRFSDKQNQINDYMKNTGLEWKDVKYPALLDTGQSSLSRFGHSAINFVSDNISRLYRD